MTPYAVAPAAMRRRLVPRSAYSPCAIPSAAGIPAAPIQTLAEQLASPHAQARALVSELPHHRLGRSPVVGQPVRFGAEKPLAPQGAPALGGDSRAVLERLGLTTDQIA